MKKVKNYAIILYKNSIEVSKGVAPPIFFLRQEGKENYTIIQE